MTYRCHKLPDLDNIYWSTQHPTEVDTNTYTTSNRLQKMNDRQYIDPWDLESLEYINSRMAPSPDPTLSPAGEPVSSAFYYIAGSEGERDSGCTACYAGLDEEMFYNAKYESMMEEDEAPSSFGNYYTDIDSSTSSTERNSSCSGSTVSTLQLHTPGFGVRASGRRSIVLPKPIPNIEFPAPPPLLPINDIDDQYTPAYDNPYCSLSVNGCCDCYECCHPVTDNVPIYMTKNAINDVTNRCYPPKNFGLSKKGLLQIDYSFNWNNLHRFMAK